MTIRRTGGDGAKVWLMIYMLLFWTSGLALLFVGLWMLLDPKRNYILHLVDLSEDDPLLTFAAYIAIVAGTVALFVGFIGCCGAVQRMRCLIVGFMLCLFVLFLADVSIGTLALVFRNKFANGQLTVYMKNLTLNRYNRDAWVKPLIDTIQFYEECCGVNSGDDYLASRWAAAVAADPIYEFEDPPLVPPSCCRQLIGSSALNPIAKSMARCQQSNTNRNWRHTTQQCCGSIGPRDYYNSFWFITNTDRGTRSFVPPSCCRQSQAGRAWSPLPIDPMCTLYYYDSQVFTSTVYNIGCHEKLLRWLDEQTYIFAGVGFGFAALMNTLPIMSWADLVNNNLVGSGNVSKAAICGFDGSIWGKSDNFKITPEEAAAAGRGFANKDGLLGTGLKFEGEKYFVLNADDDRVIGKKGSQGFFIYKTGQTVIISIYEGGVQPEACSKTTGALADYFKSINY